MKARPFTRGELRAYESLLDEVEQEYGNHGCNDFDLSEFMTREEYEPFVETYHSRNGDPLDEYDPNRDNKDFTDFAVFGMIRHRLRELLALTEGVAMMKGLAREMAADMIAQAEKEEYNA